MKKQHFGSDLITVNSSSFSPDLYIYIYAYHYHLPPWIRLFDLFQHRHIATFSWGVHNLFVLGVCSWGRVSGVCCYPFSQGGWSNFVCTWFLHLVFQRSLVLFVWFRFLFCLVLCTLQHFLESASLPLLGGSCFASWLPMFYIHIYISRWFFFSATMSVRNITWHVMRTCWRPYLMMFVNSGLLESMTSKCKGELF